MTTILVVDDDLLTVEALTDRLSFWGYNVVTAWNGQEALDKLAVSPKVDLVITDQEMPRVTGTELAAKMMEDPNLRGIPVMLRSSFPPNWNTPNVWGYSPKGINPNTFLRHLGEALLHRV